MTTRQMERWRHLSVLGVVLCLVLGTNCGASDDGSSPAHGGYDPYDGVGGYATGTGTGTVGTGGWMSTGGAPPEIEVESRFEAPIVTGEFLWSANPESNRIAVVDAATLEVKTLEAGFGATYLAAVPMTDPDASAAIVLNILADTATFFRIDHRQPEDPVTLPTHADANAWVVSPSGRWAVAWSDASRFGQTDLPVQYVAPDPTEGFQDLTLLLLEPEDGAPRAYRRVAGYRPSRVSFDSDEGRLIVVSEDGISVFDLTDEDDPEELDLVAVDFDAGVPDVEVTADGATALVRQPGTSEIGFVDVATGEHSAVTLPGRVSDLDLSEDGSRAVAVMREMGQVAVIPVPGAATDPASIDLVEVPGSFGSVSLDRKSTVGVLYTNAVPTSDVAILGLEEGDDYLSLRQEQLHAPVRAVFLSPEGTHAVALLDPPEGSTNLGAFGVVPTLQRFVPKTEGTHAPATAVAVGPRECEFALVTVRDDHQPPYYGVHVVALSTLQTDFIPLASPPLSTGIIGGDLCRGYVAQRHPEGRITFIDFPVDLADGTAPVPTARTLTGFELAARVIYPDDNE